MLTRSCAAWAPPVLLAAMTAAAFANAVPNGLVWIDHWQVESGGLIASSLAQLWSAFHQPLGVIPGWDGPAPYARPLVIAVLSLVHAVAGPDPAAYHLVLVGLHLANTLLAYSILLVLSAAPAAAFFTAAIFALHPLQTAAVSWVSGIADPLCALFVLLAFRLQLAASQRPARGLLLRLGAVLSFALALGAKETALVFPIVLAAAYFLFPTATRRTGPLSPLGGMSVNGTHTLRDGPRRRDLLRVNGHCLLKTITHPLALRSRLLLAASRRAPAGENRLFHSAGVSDHTRPRSC
jgi:hypothetical protein